MQTATSHAQLDEATIGQLAGLKQGPVPEVRSKGRVLVVDDEPALRRSILRLLHAKGFEVFAAADGAEAHSLFREHSFDVVLSDISMPGWDGIQLLRSVHSIDPDVPVVLITGEPAVSTAVKALEYGAFHYLTKPVDLHTLEEVLEKAACLRRMATMKRKAAELFSRQLDGRDLRTMERNFERALSTLWIAYQPIVHAATGKVFGYEALLRSAEETLPNPGAVIEVAEKLDQLDRLGRTVREKASQGMLRTNSDALLFVNLHTTDLLDPQLVDEEAPLTQIAHRVVLEITERSSIDKIKDVRDRVAQLRQLGFKIAVDDLGAGYAGLTSFALLEPEIVKLDMSLVRNVHKSGTRQKLIQSMTMLCKDMGMMVVGEGVETREERDALVGLGCDLLQGYLLAKPGPAFPEVNW
ncbi:MAG TPA: EAL domain-containing response regulator [Polyangiaceae bacterium]|jgi:EAL domain-containing protein (putative c-di-GMP-specific phosphodiesterase class I)|nr:EAL domain-containing response regulator [Polyangiaceae bacterium]